MENPADKILIVEDDADMAETCVRLFRRAGLAAEAVHQGDEGLEKLRRDPDFTIVLTDLRMPGMDGTEVLKKAKEIRPEADVIIMTGYGTIQNAIQAMKIGATDYITKPFDREELLKSVNQILESRRLRRDNTSLRSERDAAQEEVTRLHQELETTYGLSNIVGRSPLMHRVFARIRAAAGHDSSVLIVGETGTGKDMVARAIHYSSARKDCPFVPVNCGAIPRDLIESELFGHRKGAFTGASRDTIGLFRAADQGTLFLDEIIEMPLEIQARLLRVLQDRMVRRVGDVQETSVDVRFLAAMSMPGEQAIREGRLRQDLFYRIGVITIDLPPLRERPEDLPFLVQHFITKFNKVFPNKVEGVDPRAMDRLAVYPWPGNVRELEHVVESLFAMGAQGRIVSADLPEHLHVPRGADTASGPSQGPSALAEAEKKAVEQALRAARGNKSRAASILGISRTRLYNKMRLYGIGTAEEER
jgi:DNA-binding NtrC family response regulator